MVITIDELLKTPFYVRTQIDKVRIILEGKPRPPLELVHVEGKTVMTFDVEMYNQVDWLTGCPTRLCMFCWPCILFQNRDLPWKPVAFKTVGYKDLKHLNENLKAHEKSVIHIQSELDMHTFCRQYIFQNSVHTNQINDLIQRNRNIMKRIIDVVCLLITQQKPPRVGSKDKNELRFADCLENLEFLRVYDTQDANMIEDATEVLQISPNIMTDLVDAMARLVKFSIDKETKTSTFVSLILSEHSCDDTKCQISTILRYLYGGKVYERFLGFTNLDVNATSNDEILRHILTVAVQYEISSRLIAVTFDGAVLQDKSGINQLQKALSSNTPYAIFVPCYLHKFDEVMLQSLAVFKDCDYFFKTTRAIGSFLCKDAKTRQHFENFIHGKSSERLDYVDYAAFFSSMKNLRRYLIDYFDCVLSTCENWKAEDLTKALGFRQFLTEFKGIFLLEMFIKLFSFTGDICSALNSKMPETIFENNLVENLVRTLESERESGFEDLWRNVVNFEVEETARAKLQVDKSIHDICRTLFSSSINTMIVQIQSRFKCSAELEFFHLLNPTKYKKCIRIRDYLCKLRELYGVDTFDVSLMTNELKALYANPDLIAGKSAYEMLQLFIEADLKSNFQNVYKLAEIILTMPFKPPSPQLSSSKLDKINVWAYSSDKKEIETTSDLSMICVELDYFLQLKNRDTFYDEVILHFQQRNNSMDFLSYQ